MRIFYGDYYPLTPHSVEDNVWMAYQFHREDMKQGMMLAFRRPQSKDDSISLKLHGLLPEVNYEVTFEDTGTTKTVNGKELLSGINVTINEVPGSFLITYQQCSS